MKIRIFIAALVFMSVSQTVSFAQQYTPHELWPFINEDFAAGEVLPAKGDMVKMDLLNVSVIDGNLYYVENNMMKVTTQTPRAVTIDGVDYLNAQGRLMQVLRCTEHGAVLLEISVNTDMLNRTDAGYGSTSSVSATDNITMLEGISGALSQLINRQSFEQVQAKKNGGDEIPVQTLKYIYLDKGYLVRAEKGFIQQMPGLDRKGFQKFWKDNKVKRSDDDSLALLVEYLFQAL